MVFLRFYILYNSTVVKKTRREGKLFIAFPFVQIKRVMFLLIVLLLMTTMSLYAAPRPSQKIVNILNDKDPSRKSVKEISEIFKKIKDESALKNIVSILVQKGLTHEKPFVFLATYKTLSTCERPKVFEQLSTREIRYLKNIGIDEQ